MSSSVSCKQGVNFFFVIKYEILPTGAKIIYCSLQPISTGTQLQFTIYCGKVSSSVTEFNCISTVLPLFVLKFQLWFHK